jgi:hypothetical protein
MEIDRQATQFCSVPNLLCLQKQATVPNPNFFEISYFLVKRPRPMSGA